MSFIGGADFSQMEALDGDSYRLTDRRGRACTRDIVQFVPYRDFLNVSICPFFFTFSTHTIHNKHTIPFIFI